MFSMALDDLEKASGQHGVDVRLTADVSSRAHRKIKELGLDPTDTTGRELYHALLGMVAKHDEFLVKHLGGTDTADVVGLLPKIKSTVEHMKLPKNAWVIKCSVAKRLLKAMPPKQVMAKLGYRSIDSLLKRENIYEVYGALRFAESDEWMRAFLAKYAQLQPSDFETRKIEIIQLDGEKWGAMADSFVRKKRHNITHLKELGVIVMLPMPMKRMEGISITVLPLLLHYVNEIRLYSAFFKMQQVKPSFGKILVETLVADPSHHAVMAGNHVHWRVIQRYFGKLEHESHPEIFEPHVQPEDLHWRKAEEVLYRLEPALHFWNDMDYVGIRLNDDRPMSFSLMDMAVSYVNKLPYEQHAIYHFRESLWNEIFIRYMGQKTLEHQILKQLDNEMIEPELLAMSIRSGN